MLIVMMNLIRWAVVVGAFVLVIRSFQFGGPGVPGRLRARSLTLARPRGGVAFFAIGVAAGSCLAVVLDIFVRPMSGDSYWWLAAGAAAVAVAALTWVRRPWTEVVLGVGAMVAVAHELTAEPAGVSFRLVVGCVTGAVLVVAVAGVRKGVLAGGALAVLFVLLVMPAASRLGPPVPESGWLTVQAVGVVIVGGLVGWAALISDRLTVAILGLVTLLVSLRLLGGSHGPLLESLGPRLAVALLFAAVFAAGRQFDPAPIEGEPSAVAAPGPPLSGT